MITDMTSHCLTIVIKHRYSVQEPQVVSFANMGISKNNT